MPDLRGAARDEYCVEQRALAIRVVRRRGELGREWEGVNRVAMRRSAEADSDSTRWA
jgi:hypothetical protein